MIKKILIGFLISIPAFLSLVRPGYFPMHDDLQVMRIFEMKNCFEDGQIPCRWSSNMAFGYGQAMFQFYSAFPYYLGEFVRSFFNFSILFTAKFLFAFAFIMGSVGMLLLASEMFGMLGGILASILYTYAPYHSVDIYVRGALSESFALGLLPFIWFFIFKIIKNKKSNFVLFGSIFLSLLLTTHNISTMLIAFFTMFWVIYLLLQEKSLKQISKSVFLLFLMGLLGVGLSAYFIFPLIFEGSLIQSDLFTQDYLTYYTHFVSLHQLFLSRFWGYGGSIFGTGDLMSFQIGWPLWWIVVFGSILFFLNYKIQKIFDVLLVLLLLFIFFFAAFMAHTRSTFIWQRFEFLNFVQFPWRFLGMVIFSGSLLSGFLFSQLKRYRLLVFILITFLVFVFNISYFKPEHWFSWERDETKLSGELFWIQQKSAPYDYLPKSAYKAFDKAPSSPFVLKGQAFVSNFFKRSNFFFFDIDVYEESKIVIPIYYFPGWVVIDNNQKIFSYPSDNLGEIEIQLSKGKHMIQGRFENTKLRNLANSVTVVTFLTIIGWLVIKDYLKKEK